MQLTIKTLTQETFKVEFEPSATVLELKQKLKELKNFEVDCQKLIFAGKILANENTIESYNVSENGFIVVMVLQPKTAPAPAPATAEPTPPPSLQTATGTPPTQATEASVTQAKVESKKENESLPSVEADSGSKPNTTEEQSHSGAEATGTGSTVYNESTFLTGSALEETINNIKAMGFSEEMIRRALTVSFNNPDRAVELLVFNDPSLNQAVPVESNPSGVADPPRQQTPGLALSTDEASPGTTHLDGDAAQGQGGAQAQEPGQVAASAATTLEYLSQTPQFQQIRDLIQSNPSFLEPLLVQLQNTNPDLFEQINQNREEFFRLMTSNTSPDSDSAAEHGDRALFPPAAAPGPNDPRFVTITLTPDEQAHIETIMNFSGVTRDQAVEIFLLCDKNPEMAINYIMDNQEEF